MSHTGEGAGSASGSSYAPAMSADGQWIVFETRATNVSTSGITEANGVATDVSAARRGEGPSQFLSVRPEGTATGCATAGERPVIWSAQGNVPQASVVLFTGTNKVGEVKETGPWALFRLMDKARKENAGEQAMNATFGTGAQTAVFKVTLPGESNPFSRGGVWSFRCPVAL